MTEKTTISEHLIVINKGKFDPVNNITIFDLDNTLICPREDRAFPIDEDDITIKYIDVFTKLNTQPVVVIMTNQWGLKNSKKGLDIPQWLNRLKKFTKHLTVPYVIMAALTDSPYRKPNPGMYEHFITYFNNKIIPNTTFIGDAIGRSGDHSSCDIDFAIKCLMEFKLPEDYFRTQSEMIIIVGSPSAGKSTFVREYYPTYYRINQDTLKTRPRCIKETLAAAKRHENIIIDNTNPTVANRADYIAIAQKYEYDKIICYIKEITMDRAKELNVRKNKKLPMIAFNVFQSKYVEPTLDEGFTEIIKIPFIMKRV